MSPRRTLRRTHTTLVAAAFGAAFGLGFGCGGGDESPTPAATSASSSSPAPTRPELEPLPTIRTDARKVALGRRLFFDTQLSGDNTISCSTCHSLDHGGAEPRRTSVGIRGQVGPINSPTVLNAALNFVQFWDGRAANLAEQAAGPVANPIEMGSTWSSVVERLNLDASYREGFLAIYSDGITQANVTDAIAEYERSLLTPSRFDRYLAGDHGAISDAERRGYETFRDVGCISCHRGPNVGGSMYQKMGLVRDYFNQRGNITTADYGRYNVTHDEADRFKFKVPTLRNVALTAPYLHDGSQQTLEDVVRVMGIHQLGRNLAPEQIRSIVAFLGSLTGELPEGARPPATPAGAVPAAPTPTP